MLQHIRNLAAATYHKSFKLPQIIGERLLARLDLIRLKPTLVIDLGAANGYFTQRLKQYYNNAHVIALDNAIELLQLHQNPFAICCEANQLPLANNTVDFIFSNLFLQNYSELTPVLQEIRRVLKPDGLFLFTALGPDTLQELRQCWTTVDTKTHVHAFIDMHDIGDCLIQSAFSDPVVDMEKITFTYCNAIDLLHDLKNLGSYNFSIDRPNSLTTQKQLQKMLAEYEKLRSPSGLLPVTVEVIYGLAWRPAFSAAIGAHPAGEVHIPIHHIQKGNS